MLADSLSPLVKDAIVVCAAVVAGGLNAIAGGGTLVSFPALMLVGVPATIANATNAVALVPGSLASLWALRRSIRLFRRKALVLLAPSLAGGMVGAFALLGTPPERFEQLVPFLLLGAAGLLALQEPVSRWSKRRHGVPADAKAVDAAGSDPHWSLRLLSVVVVAQFFVSSYGGYFGGGMGIAMLALYGFIPGLGIHGSQALKSLCGAAINGMAAVVFIARGAVSTRHAIIMACGAVVGGYLFGRVAERLSAEKLRLVVVLLSVVIGALLLARRFVG